MVYVLQLRDVEYPTSASFQALIESLPTWLRRLETDATLKGLSLPELMELERTSA